MDFETLQKLALSLGLGLLVGFQREWAAPNVAGIRTFTLLTVFGTLCGLLTEFVGPWLVPVGLFVTAGLLAMGTFAQLDFKEHKKVDQTDSDVLPVDPPGLTTHVAACVMFLVGASLVLDRKSVV